MDLFDKMQNINDINIEEKIENGISNVKEELSGLTEYQTCKIYNSYLFDELRSRHL